MKKAKTLLEYGLSEAKFTRSLAQKLNMFPNHGLGFKIKNKFDPSVEYIIDKVKYDGTKQAAILGVKIKNDIKDNKITEVYAPNQFAISKIADNSEFTINGNIYNIHSMYNKIKERSSLLTKRNNTLFPQPPKEKKKPKK